MNVFLAIWLIIRGYIFPIILGTAVVWAPLLVGYTAWQWWLEYVRKATIAKAKWIMLEIRIPQEVTKSPMAFEIILNELYGEAKYPADSIPLKEIGQLWDKYWIGKWPLWWSLELVSIEGNIYFFIRCEPKNKELVENLIYSQFPQAEVTLTDDYTAYVPAFKSGNGWDLRGSEFKLKLKAKDENETPQDFIPIKTYIDYGLDEAFQLEENQKIDPLVPLLQTLGSLGQGEQAWIQIVLQGASKRMPNPDPTKTDKVYWTDWGRKFVDDLLKKYSTATLNVKAKEEKDNEYIQTGGFKNLPEAEKPRVEAIERKLTKYPYDCGIRAVYMGHKEHFRKDKFGEIANAFKQFGAPNLNSFDKYNETDGGFDYPWQDYKDIKKIVNREKMFKRYVKREFFFPKEMGATVWIKKKFNIPISKGSLKDVAIIGLNTEELATLFHFPGRVAETSALGRIEAQKAEPPANLPI